jgi:hypothetical protein
MRCRKIILFAVVVLMATVLSVAVPVLGGNAASPSPQGNAPMKVWPRPLPESPEASSPAVPLPTATPTATAATIENVPGGNMAKVIGADMDPTTSSGGTIAGYVVVRNSGNDTIKDVAINVDFMQKREGGREITVAHQSQTLSNLNIAPGDRKRVGFSISVPVSLPAGNFNVHATVQANGRQIGAFRKTVTIV